jgi:hypothetical protein
VTSADVTLSAEVLSAGRIVFTDALTANRVVNFPMIAEQAGHSWELTNLTTGPFTLTLKVSGQTGFVLEKGEQIRGTYNGTDLTRTSPLAISRRYELKWVAGNRGKPGINADIQDATEAAREIADPDFEILGTNGTSVLCTFNGEGGIKITTDAGANDQMIVAAHTDANQTAWFQTTWGTDRETQWEALIQSGGNIGAAILWAGLKLTNTPTVATDNDQVFFRYQNAVTSGRWVCHYSIGGVDSEIDSGVTVATSTFYHLRIAIDAARIARFYINGALVGTSTALTDATDLKNYIGVQCTGAGAARALVIFGQAISRVPA